MQTTPELFATFLESMVNNAVNKVLTKENKSSQVTFYGVFTINDLIVLLAKHKTEPNYSKSTIRMDNLVLTKLAKKFGIDYDLQFFTVSEAMDFISDEMKTAPSGINNYLRSIIASFNLAIRLQKLKMNVWIEARKIINKRSKTPPAVINYKTLLKVCMELKTEYASIVEFIYLIGTRPGEAINLKFSDYNSEDKTLTIGSKEHTTKTKEYRIIPLSDNAVKLIEARRNKIINISGYIFTQKNGKKFTVDCLSKNFKTAVRKLNLDESLHLHSLRASHVSLMASTGTPIQVVSKLLGHSSTKTTERFYQNLDIDLMRMFVNRLNDAV